MAVQTSDAGPFFVYLLESLNDRKRGATYIGFTTTPPKRLRQHNGEVRGGPGRSGLAFYRWIDETNVCSIFVSLTDRARRQEDETRPTVEHAADRFRLSLQSGGTAVRMGMCVYLSTWIRILQSEAQLCTLE